MKTAVLSLSAIALLTACGGSGTSGQSYTTLSNRGINLLNEYANATPTPSQNLPSGSFTYNGVAAYSQTSSQDPATILATSTVVSNIQLTANFAQNSMSGSLSNFVDYTEAHVTGSIPLTGTISSNGFTASGSAVLVDPYGQNVFASGNLSGLFFGNNAEATSGLMTGTYDGYGYNGIFLAER